MNENFWYSEFWANKVAALDYELKQYYMARPGSTNRNKVCARCALVSSEYYTKCPVCNLDHTIGYGVLLEGHPSSTEPFSGLPTEDAERKKAQLWTYLMEYFPDSFLAEVGVAVAGNEQHNPGQPLHWAREKSTDHYNTAFRHMFDHGRGVKRDKDGQWHLAKAIWRLKAALQLEIEAERKQK